MSLLLSEQFSEKCNIYTRVYVCVCVRGREGANSFQPSSPNPFTKLFGRRYLSKVLCCRTEPKLIGWDAPFGNHTVNIVDLTICFFCVFSYLLGLDNFIWLRHCFIAKNPYCCCYPSFAYRGDLVLLNFESTANGQFVDREMTTNFIFCSPE